MDGPQFDDQGLLNTDPRTIAVPESYVNNIPTDIRGVSFSRTPAMVRAWLGIPCVRNVLRWSSCVRPLAPCQQVGAAYIFCASPLALGLLLLEVQGVQCQAAAHSCSARAGPEHAAEWGLDGNI